jgi:hypothetical protein
MAESGYTARIARHLDRPVEAACAVRSPGTSLILALCAGVGAGIGAVAGGSAIFAGAGGGLGALVGYLIGALLARGRGHAAAMVLVLGPDRLDLMRLGPFGTRPVGTLRSIAYADITDVAARNRLLEIRLVLQIAKERLELDGGRRGVGAAPPVVEELQRRVAAEQTSSPRPDTSQRPGTAAR